VIYGYEFQDGVGKLLARELESVHPVNLRRIHHAADVFGKPEDGWAAGGFVATDAFENRAAITDDMREDVNLWHRPTR
jgi:hypothetical protein